MILVQFDFWYGKVANKKLENDSLVTSGEKEKERGGLGVTNDKSYFKLVLDLAQP